MTENTVYLDTEGTGLDPATEAMLEIAIVDDAGAVLVNTLIAPPAGISSWPEAQRIHGITPTMTAGAPELAQLAPQIEAAVCGRDVVIYNAAFDTGFLGPLLDSARSVQCCMEAWSEHMNEWDSRFGRLRWHRLAAAADSIHFAWPGQKHRALADTLACRAVWQYLHSPHERERVDTLIRDRQLTTEARNILRSDERKVEMRNDRWRDYMTSFLQTWWLHRYGAWTHWTRGLSTTRASTEFSQLFFGKSPALLALEDQVSQIYTSRKAIPDNLHPASYFLRETWFKKALSPSAAYIGKKSGWLLYDTSEDARIRALFPLRFQEPVRFPGDALLTRSALLKAGMTAKQIAALKPVAERKNGFNGEWYNLYLVEKQSLPAPDTVPSNCCTPERPASNSLTVDAVQQILKSQQGEN
ncbi:3'-5' exonuclease [Shigella sonnei]|uniref:DNA polymerase III subunit epsilon n=1 Tax=Escherichia coli TaxID=562 RepID=A0A1V2GIY8_ECOLX|nr:3'-5' exonuclease [Escherichia coli]EAB8175336.1 3'-5' exonuclease [Salmonella enterica subsp. enterica serovar Enteritidis]EDW6768369.1 3'-5' exonuclease [Salmonella enterica subsp. enterica serovar Johannesburg]EFV9882640.1 3'-5' exonuclease [Shigella sonnei]EKJ2620763.1 3'-5' exonuclease [Shigella flexneri]HBN2914555.1 3'-5' exonuclease [Escherichia coli O25b:H4-ST131]